jgi:hypothetical protein
MELYVVAKVKNTKRQTNYLSSLCVLDVNLVCLLY